MRSLMIRLLAMLAALMLVAAACGDDDDTASEPTSAEDDSAAGGGTGVDGGAEVAMGPASVVAEDQDSDGSSVVVASVTLPSPGFIAVHGDGGGSPGPVIGHSDLLPAGESTDVVVMLDEALVESGVVFPMAHIDVDGDGVYEFFPPDETTDGPAMTADGAVAVVPAIVTVGGR